jgi:transmembrane protein TMEM174 (potassium channel)
MYPKARIDALTDGIFAVAMTLLVLELKLPEQAFPRDNAELMHDLTGLWPKFFPYLLSFFVLGISWLFKARIRTGEMVGTSYAFAWLVNLIAITCVPFSTMLLGSHESFSGSCMRVCNQHWPQWRIRDGYASVEPRPARRRVARQSYADYTADSVLGGGGRYGFCSASLCHCSIFTHFIADPDQGATRAQGWGIRPSASLQTNSITFWRGMTGIGRDGILSDPCLTPLGHASRRRPGVAGPFLSRSAPDQLNTSRTHGRLLSSR